MCNDASTSKTHKTERTRKKQPAFDTSSSDDDCYIANKSKTTKRKRLPKALDTENSGDENNSEHLTTVEVINVRQK